jgi:hypothetical protein
LQANQIYFFDIKLHKTSSGLARGLTVGKGFLSPVVYLISEFGDLPELYLTGMNLKK